MCVSESPWRKFLTEWPEAIPHRGIAVTSFGEQIPFNGFITSENFVMFSRNTPDSLGSRTVMLLYKALSAVKMTDVIKGNAFQAAGFQGQLGRQ